MAARITRAVRAEAVAEPLPGLHLHRASHPHERIHSITKPAFCVIAQGRKEMCVGEIGYRYDAEHYLLTTVDLPFTGGDNGSCTLCIGQQQVAQPPYHLLAGQRGW